MTLTRKELFVVDPNDFVERRDELVRELRARGEKTEAAAVKKLRRPSIPLWAFNVVATSRTDVARQVVTAADAARVAQRALLEGSDADEFRDALTQRRESLTRALNAAGDVIAGSERSRETYARDVEDALDTIVASPQLCSQFRDGELTTIAPDEADTTDLFAGMEPPDGALEGWSRPPKPTRGPKAVGRATLNVTPKVESSAAPAPTPATSPRLVRARAGVEHAEKQLVEAERELDAAQLAADLAIERRTRATEHRDREQARLVRSRELAARFE